MCSSIVTFLCIMCPCTNFELSIIYGLGVSCTNGISIKKINIMMPINIMRLVMFDFFLNRTKFKYFNRTSTLNFVFMKNVFV